MSIEIFFKKYLNFYKNSFCIDKISRKKKEIYLQFII